MLPASTDGLLVADREPRGADCDDEDLRVGVDVEVGALAAVHADDEDRGVDVVAALEQRRPRAAGGASSIEITLAMSSVSRQVGH